MSARGFRIYTFGLAAALLAGCSGSLPSETLGSGKDAPAKSWMSGGAAKSDLLYVSNVNGTVTAYDYWSHTLIGTLTGFSRPKGECVDATGDVFITDRVAEDIVEYQHGGTSPVAVLSDTGFQDYACSVDPTTGNLAVANSYRSDGTAGGIAVYKNELQKPRYYHVAGAPNPQTCAYDARGDLLAASDYLRDGWQVVALVYLPKGASTFVRVDAFVNGMHESGVYNVQWDGRYWAVLYNNAILRFRIGSNGKATHVSTTHLHGNAQGDARFWIQSFGRGRYRQGTQVVAAQPNNAVLFWRYPSGGVSTGSVTAGTDSPYGVAVSLAR